MIGDITTQAERGSLIGVSDGSMHLTFHISLFYHGSARMLGQSIGLVFGGILTHLLGFCSIFWFLAVLGGIALHLTLAFSPRSHVPLRTAVRWSSQDSRRLLSTTSAPGQNFAGPGNHGTKRLHQHLYGRCTTRIAC